MVELLVECAVYGDEARARGMAAGDLEMTRPVRPSKRAIADTILMGAPDGWNAPAWVRKASDRKQHTGPRKKDEDALQIAVVQLLSQLPHTLHFSIGNHIWVGEMSGKKLGYLAKQKRMGMLRGVSDLEVIFRVGDEVRVVFLELKVKGNYPSAEQKEFISRASALGCTACVCHSIDEVVETLNRAGHPALSGIS